MTAVYIVTQGDHDEYRIRGIFSSEDKAKEFMGSEASRFNTIEPRDLDPPPIEWVPLYCVWLGADGSDLYPPAMRMVEATDDRCGKGTVTYTVHPFGSPCPGVERRFSAQSLLSMAAAREAALGAINRAKAEHPEWFTDGGAK